MTAKDHAKGNDLVSNDPDGNSSPSNPPSESTLNTEIDRILTRLEQLGLAPTAIEKIASGDVFEAHNEAKSEILKLINGANTMTGQEFYQRFEKEAPMSTEPHVFEAARRAAGIEE